MSENNCSSGGTTFEGLRVPKRIVLDQEERTQAISKEAIKNRKLPMPENDKTGTEEENFCIHWGKMVKNMRGKSLRRSR